MTSLKTSIKTITYLSDIGCLEIQGASLSLDYTKGDDIENPLQGVVGINVTW
ncbi:autotransporter [Escherichia coli]|nr:autotransporter [Escherichia coli]